MQLQINGKSRTFEAPLTLAQLLEKLGMKPGRVAIELNRAIVSREKWASTQLNQDDKLEIVHFVGGGSRQLSTLREHQRLSQATVCS